MPESTESAELIETLAPLVAAPQGAAVLLDLDGTLAPIVDRPEDAAVPERALEALRAVAERYALTAVITGRPPLVAREIVGLGGIAYAGNHGFEVLPAGAAEPLPSPALQGRSRDAAEFEASLDAQELRAAGIRTEDKGPIVALHWRTAPDRDGAESLIERVAADAARAGLATHLGRMVLELRPAIDVDKGDAVSALLAGREIAAALYAGDDRTDLDAFRALQRLRDTGELQAIVRVGVRSAEGPSELVEESDLVVDGPEAMPALLEALVR